MQEELSFKVRPEDITDNYILSKCKNFRDALILCVECSDKDPKQIISELKKLNGYEMDESTFSKCLSRNTSQPRNFPSELVEALEDIAGNLIPTRFKALHRHFNLTPMKNRYELMIESLIEENKNLKNKVEVINDFLKDRDFKL